MNVINFEISSGLLSFIPEIILAILLCCIILTDVLTNNKQKKVISLLFAIGMILTFVSLVASIIHTEKVIFWGMLRITYLSYLFKGIFVLAGFFVVLFTETQRSFRVGINRGEYYSLITSAMLGMFLAASANNLLMLYISIELMSLSSYALAGFNKLNKKSNEAALKYMLFGAVASGTMIYGMSILYGLFGSLDYGIISSQVGSYFAGNLMLLVACVMVLAGLGYKIAAVPFHLWCPDVYEGAPTPVTGFFSVAPKAAGFAALLNFVNVGMGINGLNNYYRVGSIFNIKATDFYFGSILLLMSILTMTIGNLSALKQNNVKRILAYSSIAHAGYMLMAVPVVMATGEYLPVRSVMFYLFIYTFMNMGAFYCVNLFQDLSGSETLEGYKGLGWKMPIAGGAMVVFLISLTGLPPLAGFIAKFYLFSVMVKAHFVPIVIIAVINSVISLFYYAKIIKALFLEKTPAIEGNGYVHKLTAAQFVVLLYALIPIIIFGIFLKTLFYIVTM